MKTFPWILAGVGVGLVAYFLVDRFSPGYADVNRDVENASGKMSIWGFRARMKGKRARLVGTLKERAGQVLNNDRLIAEGLGDKAFGAVESAEGHASQGLGQVLHSMST